jgi:stage II sporulation protein P
MVKAVADRVYPGLIKDIYMGRGAFNQDLLPGSLLLECGTYTLEKERVLASMPMMADVLDRALYGGVVGAAGNVQSDAGLAARRGGVVQGQADYQRGDTQEVGSGLLFLGAIGLLGIVGLSLLSAGSMRGGMRKAGRSLREMTGGLVGRKPEPGEEHDHS